MDSARAVDNRAMWNDPRTLGKNMTAAKIRLGLIAAPKVR